MIDREFAQEFAQEWVEAWNAHDLERVLSHYSDDFKMTSPFIAAMTGEPSGSLKGKDKVGEYWKAALEKLPDLKFELKDVLFSINTIAIYYQSVLGKMAVEVLVFGDEGKVIEVIAHYDKF